VNVDALGNPLRFRLTAGQAHDITQAKALIANFQFDYLTADKSYDSDHFIQAVRDNEAVPVIPPRSNRKVMRDYDKYIYRERHLVECFINKIKRYPRVFSRFEKLSTSYMAFCASLALSSGYAKMSTQPSNPHNSGM
jgi:transposase